MEGTSLPYISLPVKPRTGICSVGKYDSVVRMDDFRNLPLNRNKQRLDRWARQVGSDHISIEVRERGKFDFAGALD